MAIAECSAGRPPRLLGSISSSPVRVGGSIGSKLGAEDIDRAARSGEIGLSRFRGDYPSPLISAVGVAFTFVSSRYRVTIESSNTSGRKWVVMHFFNFGMLAQLAANGLKWYNRLANGL